MYSEKMAKRSGLVASACVNIERGGAVSDLAKDWRKENGRGKCFCGMMLRTTRKMG